MKIGHEVAVRFWNLDGVPVVMDPTREAQTLDDSATSVDTLNGFGVPLTAAVFASLGRRGSQRCSASVASSISGWLLVLAADAKKEKHAELTRGRLRHSGPTCRGHNSDCTFAKRKDRRQNKR